MLAERGACLDATNDAGHTPLAIAEGIPQLVFRQQPETAALLRRLVASRTAPPCTPWGHPDLQVSGTSAPSRRWNGRTTWQGRSSGRTWTRGSSPNLHLVERFSRVDADSLLYEFTVADPTTWTRPWTAQVSMKKIEDPIFEYACHEDNYGLYNILAVARAVEKAAAEATSPGSR